MKTFSIGRDLGCDIVINDTTDVVSRRHALVCPVIPTGYPAGNNDADGPPASQWAERPLICLGFAGDLFPKVLFPLSSFPKAGIEINTSDICP